MLCFGKIVKIAHENIEFLYFKVMVTSAKGEP